MKNNKKDATKRKDEKVSIRGKLEYFQELIHQKEKEKRDENELEI